MFGKTVKNTMFADDCTVIIDSSEQSYNTAVYLFEEFGKLSGLNLNFSKCVPLKIGSLRNEHDLIYSKKKEILWNKETAKALGIFFHSQIKQVLELNYQHRIENFRKDITIWNKLFDLLIKYNFNVTKNKFNTFLYTRDRLLPYIYMFAKFYIYQCKFKNTIPNIETFQIKLKNRKTLEHNISISSWSLLIFLLFLKMIR